eukprot:9969272-Alexandrium_andersonii.AAC.1
MGPNMLPTPPLGSRRRTCSPRHVGKRAAAECIFRFLRCGPLARPGLGLRRGPVRCSPQWPGGGCSSRAFF